MEVVQRYCETGTKRLFAGFLMRLHSRLRIRSRRDEARQIGHVSQHWTPDDSHGKCQSSTPPGKIVDFVCKITATPGDNCKRLSCVHRPSECVFQGIGREALIIRGRRCTCQNSHRGEAWPVSCGELDGHLSERSQRMRLDFSLDGTLLR